MMNTFAESLTGWKKEEAEGQHLDTVFRMSTKRHVSRSTIRRRKR
jgi:hypothetical protein